MKRKNIVGKLINFRGLVYSPINEQGVVFLFGKVAHEFGMYVELIRTGCPDCIAKRYVGKDKWEDIRIEFEFKSSDFLRHKHKTEDADMIVCWEHDWQNCPKSIEILELKNEINKLENISVEAPDRVSKSGEHDIDEHLKRVSKESVEIFNALMSRGREFLEEEDKRKRVEVEVMMMFARVNSGDFGVGRLIALPSWSCPL